MYSLEEILAIVKQNVKCEITPRSLRLRPSGINENHPLILSAKQMGEKVVRFTNPLPIRRWFRHPSIKMGPGDSARSHSADEFIYVDEIRKGIESYIRLIEGLWNSGKRIGMHWKKSPTSLQAGIRKWICTSSRFDVLGSLAHIQMLQSINLLTKDELSLIKQRVEGDLQGNRKKGISRLKPESKIFTRK